MNADPLLLTSDGDLAWMTLNRPEKRNALTEEMWATLPAMVAKVERCSEAKVLIVRGAGGAFAAGADIAEFETVYATRARAAAYAEAVASGVESLAACEKPVIAAIEGPCVGGGCALALACDLRLAGRGARFGITPGRLGLNYSLRDTKRLVDAVGPSRAKDMLFTGRLIDAEEALSFGLLDGVFAGESLEAEIRRTAGAIASASQWSARKTKSTIRMILEGVAEDTEETRAWFLDSIEGEDFQEGRAAFLEKRPPRFPFR